MTKPWRIWLRLDIERECVVGAVGPHACASLGVLTQELPLTGVPVWIDKPPTSKEIASVVILDVPLLARDPSLVRLVPPDAGCLLIVPSDCTDGEIDTARTALGTRPAWIALCHSGVEGFFGRHEPYNEAVEHTVDCAKLVSFALDCPDVLARAGARHRDALLRCATFWGTDNAARFTGHPLERMLRDRPYLTRRCWRRAHTKRILRIDGPVRAEFRELIDALPARPSGRRFDVQVISDEDIEPLNDPRTFWQVIKLEWLARKG